MYAVIETGGKQYRVEPGDVIDVEHLPVDEDDTTVTFDRVLMVRDKDAVQVGSPLVEGASVTASVLDRVRGRKVLVFKMKRRKGYRRRQGHRQGLHRVKIESIASAGAAPTAAAAEEE